MARIWSHSRLACFENCPKQFHFRYVLRLPVDTESIEAFLGKQVHAVLERLHRFVVRGRVPGLAGVLSRFEQNWQEHFDADRIRIARSEQPVSSYQESGARCLRNYYRRHYPFDAEETLGVEEKVTFQLDAGGRYPVRGVIDRLARAPDGAVEIQDYKTGQRLPPQRVLDEDRQLALYQLGLNGRFGPETPVRLVWHYLWFDQVRVSTRDAEQLRKLESRTRELIDRIQAEERFEPRPSPLCRWCEFNDRCPASEARSEPKASEASAASEARSEPKASGVTQPAGERSHPAGRRAKSKGLQASEASQLGLFG